MNLLSNASKFTAAGKIELFVTIDPAQNLVFIIKDTGIGIPEDKVDYLFSRFTQADTSITKRFGGTGLGLAIVNQLVTLMGGSIDVQSKLSRGSTFTIKIPVEIPEAPAFKYTVKKETNFTPAYSKNHFKVLHVDDIVENRFLVKAFLKQTGADVIEASNGQEAVEVFNTHRVDVILMDMQMPVMDGYSATLQIREIERIRGGERTPIIAVSAYALNEEIDKSLAAGCDLHMTKPIRKHELLASLKRYISKLNHPNQWSKSYQFETDSIPPDDSTSI